MRYLELTPATFVDVGQKKFNCSRGPVGSKTLCKTSAVQAANFIRNLTSNPSICTPNAFRNNSIYNDILMFSADFASTETGCLVSQKNDVTNSTTSTNTTASALPTSSTTTIATPTASLTKEASTPTATSASNDSGSGSGVTLAGINPVIIGAAAGAIAFLFIIGWVAYYAKKKKNTIK
jgi:hypothetical protein